MNDKDMSILVQVAYKEAAIDARTSGTDVTSDAGILLLMNLTTAHADVLVAEVNSRLEGLRGTAAQVPAPQVQVAAAVGAPQFDAQASIDEAFAGTQVFPTSISAKNGWHENTAPPAWLEAKVLAAGETEVYDNRGEIAGTRKPHFRCANVKDAKGMALGFWP